MWRADRLLVHYRAVSGGTLLLDFIAAANASIDPNYVIEGDATTVVTLDELRTLLGFDFLENIIRQHFWKCVENGNLTIVEIAIVRQYAVNGTDSFMNNPDDEEDAKMIALLLTAPPEYGFLKHLARMPATKWPGPPETTPEHLSKMLEILCQTPGDILDKLEELKRRGIDVNSYFKTVLHPHWGMLFFEDYTFTDAQWENAARPVVEEARTNFSVRKTRLEELAALATRQNKQRVLKKLLAETKELVTSVNFKRTRDELESTLEPSYGAAGSMPPLEDQIKHALVQTLKKHKQNLKNDIGWDVVESLRRTISYCADIIPLVFTHDDLCAAIERGMEESLKNLAQHLKVSGEDIEVCRPKDRRTSATLMDLIGSYGKVLGRFTSALWPTVIRTPAHGKDLLVGVLLRSDPKITKTPSDVDMLLHFIGGDEQTNLIAALNEVPILHYTVARIYAAQLTADQVTSSVATVNLSDHRQMNALTEIILKIATALHENPNVSTQPLIASLRGVFRLIRDSTSCDEHFRIFFEAFQTRMNHYAEGPEDRRHMLEVAKQIVENVELR